MSQMLGQAAAAIEGEPRIAPLVLQTLQWAAAGFKNGRVLEGILDQAVNDTMQELQKQAQQPPPPPPEVLEAQADIQRDNQESMAKMQRDNMEAQNEIQQDNLDAANERRLAWLKGETDADIARMIAGARADA